MFFNREMNYQYRIPRTYADREREIRRGSQKNKKMGGKEGRPNPLTLTEERVFFLYEYWKKLWKFSRLS